MKILLTGASGFIGHYVLMALQHYGFDVVAIGHSRIPVPVRQIQAELGTKFVTAVSKLEIA